jgi:Protein of unknown function (DUF3431)/Putative papain-like cysteine peptidase (DUF1796)
MKFIPIGLQCSVPEGIKRAKLREYSYPFDWLWTPSKTVYQILEILLNEGIDAAIIYMTTGYTYYVDQSNEHYKSVHHVTNCQMNAVSGLGVTHFTMDELKGKLRARFERFLKDIREDVMLIYADAANPYFNYHLDEVKHGLDATEDLKKIYDLLYPLNNKIRITYFCWAERKRDTNGSQIEYVPFDYKPHWKELSDVIKEYVLGIKAKITGSRIKFVIARYQENLEWANGLNCVIYSKDSSPHNSAHPVISLPNIGREGHTYLHHIITNYDNLDDYTVFLQGYPFDHTPYLEDIIREIQNSVERNEPLAFRTISKTVLEIVVKDHVADWNGYFNLDEVYTKIFGKSKADQRFSFGAGAQFVVSKETILSRPKSFYENMITLLDKECNPPEGYAVERLWTMVFTHGE